MPPADTGLEEVLAALNPEQRRAVLHRGGPLLIVAGAGTGKTTTLAHRVASLIVEGVDPGRMLLLTFTRRAAAEMLRRVDGILNSLMTSDTTGRAAKAAARKVWGGTFHAVGTRLLRHYGAHVGLPPEFTILDRSDSEDLLNVLRTELQLGGTGSRFPLKGTCLDIYSRCINSRERLADVLERVFPWCREHEEDLKALFKAYVDRKEEHAILDYDDLLTFWLALVTHERAGSVVRERFDAILVDEYQDTNVVQAEILRGLMPDGRALTVVGDDAQSIYSFRAATVRNILDFPETFPGTTVVTLEQNYRSTQPLLDATNAVIAQAAERYVKELRSARVAGERPRIVTCMDEDEQTDFVVDRVLENREDGLDLKRQAVLFRASHHSLNLEIELARRNVPFHKYGGLKFVETAHVKDLLSFLRLAENPRDAVAGTRALSLLPGIGRQRSSALLGQLSKERGQFRAWQEFSPPAAARVHWPLFVALMQTLGKRAGQRQTVAEEVAQVRRFYAPLLEERYDNPRPRLRDLEQIEALAARYTDRMTFLEELTLDPPSSTQDFAGEPLLDEDYLILSTIHSAKGLEWDAVFLLHAADGNIPSDMSTGSEADIEEERRLFYVALTRAKNQLYVCHPQRFYFQGRFRGDAYSYSQLTRFLPRGVADLFERRVAVQAEERADSEPPQPHLTTDAIRREIKNMWS